MADVGAWRRGAALASLAAAGFAVTFFWGRRLGPEIRLDASPFVGHWELRPAPVLLAPVALAALLVWTRPEEWLSRTQLLAATFVAAAAWGISLALVDGPDGLTMGLASPHDYLAALPDIDSPGDFVRTFTERIDRYPVHVRGHPPGLVVALWWLERAGLGGVVAPAAIAIAAGASVPVAALVAAEEVGGASLQRRAAPFLALSPAAIWLVTSADAIVAGVGAWAVAAMVVASRRAGRRSDMVAAGGGALIGSVLLLSYGASLLVPVAFVVPAARRRWRPLAVATLVASAAIGAFAWRGFWYLDGLRATRREYFEGIGSVRPYTFFLLANLVVFAVAVGPGAVAGLAHLRDNAAALLIGTALAVVVAADLSGLSKGEVERIWLPFWPWVGLAAAGLPAASRRAYLATGAAVTVGLASVLFTPW